MNRKTKIALGLALGVSALTASGAGVWWWRQSAARGHCKAPTTAQVDTTEYKYVGLDKIIVMLRRPPGDTSSHYLAMDLVFKTATDSETAAREQLPLLRSIAVKNLSTMTVDVANNVTIEELTARLNEAFVQSYAPRHAAQPFAEAMIGKLVVE